MGRKITQQEIDGLKGWNETPGRKYVSVEAYQDMLDWLPDPESVDVKAIQEILKGEIMEEKLEEKPQTNSVVVGNPELAKMVERWNQKYAKSYDLSSVREQADFYEGVLEMARHMAASSSTGQLSLTLGPSGPNELRLNVVPLD